MSSIFEPSSRSVYSNFIVTLKIAKTNQVKVGARDLKYKHLSYELHTTSLVIYIS